MKYKSRFFFSLHSNRQFAFGPPSFSIIKNASQGSLKKWKENFTLSQFLTYQFRGDLGRTLWLDSFDDIKLLKSLHQDSRSF